jgi:hypothetical protein
VNSLAPHVKAEVERLAADADTLEIWLAGSRANGNAHEKSDWDLIVFSGRDPTPIARQVVGVDVIHVGPHGMFLLEGMSEHFMQPFADFHWQDDGGGVATYRSKRLISFEPGTVRNSDQPSVIVASAKAVLLFKHSVLSDAA